MKKLAFSILTLLVVISSTIAGTVEHIYSFNSINVARSGDFQTVNFAGTLLTGLPGEPLLPYQQVKLLLPSGETAESIELIGSDEIVMEGRYQLSPQQNIQPVSKGNSGTFLKNNAVYTSSSKYPAQASGKLLSSYLNGHSFALSSFTPVRYVPATGQVSYFSKVKVIVHTRKSAEATTALANIRQSESIRKELAKFSDNPQMMESYHPEKSAAADEYDILIITPSNYSYGFETLRSAYLSEGLQSKVVTTENIAMYINGIDLQEKIRNYIIQQYQQSGIQYVVLGGDEELVPSRGFYCFVQSSSVYEDYGIPSDLYYSALDGNWNTDGDEKWAEPGEDDLLPEVSVGRLSFSNQSELQRMINKTYKYQFSPVPGEFRKVLLAGENLYNNPLTNGSDYLELLVGQHDDNGYATSGIPGTYGLSRMYDEETYWSGSDLIAKLNLGYPMLHHSGHANETYVMKLSNSDITNDNFSAVNGVLHNYTLVYTHGCLCGSFDFNDCIAEKMVSINNFAVAFVGNSRYGWFNEGQTEGPSAHLHREFLDAIYTDKLNRLGTAHMESKRATAPWVTAPGQWEPGALRWCFYDCNVLGDPVMAVWADNPMGIVTTYPSNISVGTSGINVNVMSGGNNASGLTCVVLMNGVILGKGITGSDGSTAISFNMPILHPGNAELVVSGYNCQPTSYAIIIDTNTGTAEIDQNNNLVQIHPNPITDMLNIDYTNLTSGIVSIFLTSTDGKTLQLKKAGFETSGSHSFNWNSSGLAPGVYSCTVKLDEKQLNQRFIKR